ncbi:MAG TPA: TRAP transporter large permease subunit [Acetobacteraceae bacterium]|jgi:tripartite ATP-independent transporter DctM subunit|nr:TRAP transporter large permease subunit [Acetobacteraceae bacterium]
MSLDSSNLTTGLAPPIAPGWAALRRIAFLLDQAIGKTCEFVGALLVLAEVCILFAGVVSRYVLDSPLFWTDELANFLFLWLSMLGMVVALRRDGHMRLTTLANWVPPQWASWFAAVASLVVIAFVLEVLLPAAQYLDQQRYVELISLQISDGYRVVAIVVGISLAAIISLLRLLETTTVRSFSLALATVAGIAALLWLCQPLLLAMGFGSLIVFFVVIVAVCVGIGVPIAFAFGIATMSYLGLTSALPLSVVVNRMDEGMSNLLLLSVPMFVFLGLLMEMTGIARVMVAFLAALVGHVRGGLSYVLLGAMYLVSGISGSKAADMAAVAPVLFPEMRRRGSHPGELAALLASSSAMSETIPPSLVLITIGSVTNVSITALFTGGLLPAAVAALALVVVCWIRSRHMDTGGGERAPVSMMLRTFVIAIPGLTLPFVIRIAVIDGIATATEVSTVGVVYTAVLGLLVYRQFDWRRIYPLLVDTLSLTGAVMLIIGTATAMAWALTQSGFSQWLVSVMASVPGGKLGFLAITAIAFVILGSVLEGIPAIVLFGPLLFPVAKAMGVHEVHYALVIILAMGIGLFAPPFGVGFYGACAIGRVSPDDALGRMWPYLAALAVALAIVVAVPWLSIGFL